jgi:hypothetical protein
MLVVPVTQEADTRRFLFKVSSGQISMKPYLKNILKQKRLVEWLKCSNHEALSSSPSTAPNKQKRNPSNFSRAYLR